MKQQFIALLATRGLASVLNALSFIWLGRLVGVEMIGVLGVVTSVTQFVFLVGDFGMATYVSRERARGNDSIVAQALFFNMISTVLFGLIVTALLTALSFLAIIPWPLVMIGVGAALEKNTETSLSVPIADRNKSVPAVNVIVRRILALAVFAVVISLGLDPVLAFCLGTLIAGIVGQLHIRAWMRGKVATPPARRRSDIAQVARAAWPFWVSNVTSGARTLDISIVGALASPYSAGLYSAASKIMNPFRLIPSTLTSLVVPYAAAQNNAGALRISFKLVALFMSTLLLVVPLAFLGPDLTSLLMGPDFAAAGPMFGAMLVGLPFVALAPPLGSVLQSQGDERFVGLNGTVFAILTVVLITAGAFLASGEGAAWGLTLAYVGKCGVLLTRIVRRFR